MNTYEQNNCSLQQLNRFSNETPKKLNNNITIELQTLNLETTDINKFVGRETRRLTDMEKLKNLNK